MKGLAALAFTCVFLVVLVARFLTRKSFADTLQALGLGCFAVMAATHVFEAFEILPRLGWGQPDSVGHRIDMTAALLGVALISTSFLLRRHR